MTSPREDGRPASGLAERALRVMPGGASHDARQLEPHGLFVRNASGAYKFGADGKAYIDLQCGNGSLLLGHGFRPAIDAGRAALEDGFNFSAGTEAEIRWAEIVCRLMPAVEQVRFTGSGNEACALAFAVARAVSGRGPVLTMRGHYCGWVGPALLARSSAQDVLCGRVSGDLISLAEAENFVDAAEALASGRFSALIIEPTGASYGKIPLTFDTVRALGDAARRNGSLVIFDETITGFRVSPGGAQALCGVTPDLTVLGKILGGGLPCGALAGRREHLAVLDKRSSLPAGKSRVSHMGTGNGNPVVAAVGTATLAAIEDGSAIDRANKASMRLRSGLNEVFAEAGVLWRAYGEQSAVHIFLNPQGRALTGDVHHIAIDELLAGAPLLVNELRVRLLDNGVDVNGWPGGVTSSAHDDAVVDDAIVKFATTLANLKRDGVQLTGWGRA